MTVICTRRSFRLKFRSMGMVTVLGIMLACVLGPAIPMPSERRDDTRKTEGVVGVYHWDGEAATSLHEGVERIARLGFRNVRIVLSPRYYSDYHIKTAPCYPGYALSKLLGEPDVQQALGNPNIGTFMLTAYDGVTWGDCGVKHYMVPAFFTREHTQAIEKEYSDFIFVLLGLKSSRGKRFIVSHWEGDNDVYCGSVYAYTRSANFRENCDASYAAGYGGNTLVTDSLLGLRLWLLAREKGIADGVRRAKKTGITDAEVYHAPEFNSVRALFADRFPSVLRDVVPFLRSAYVSYSAYESIAGDNPAGMLKDDLDAIYRLWGSRNIIIGEAGFPRSYWKDAVVPRTELVRDVALAWGVAQYFQWNLYDQGATENLGLFDLKGRITPLGTYYKSHLKK